MIRRQFGIILIVLYSHPCFFLAWGVVSRTCIYSEWYKVMCSDHLQVTLPDGGLQRWGHSTTAITLCPGLVEVIVFGGCPDDYDPERPDEDDPRIAETTIITFSE